MILNGSADPEVSAGADTIHAAGERTEEEFFKGILELSRQTSLTIAHNQAIATRQTSTSAGFRRFIRKHLL